MGARHPERLLALSRDVGRVAVLAQAAAQEAGELRIILDHEDTHALVTVPAGM